MQKILIDCSLTGGRGPAKKTAEFVWECQKMKVKYFLVTDVKIAFLLREIGITPNKIIKTKLSEQNEKIYKTFREEFKNIDFDFLIKFGARPVGPYIAKEKNIPYVIVDGGLPDKYEPYPSLYDKKTYIDANKIIITTNFPWKVKCPSFLKNIEICYFPISTKTKKYIKFLQKTSKEKTLQRIEKFLTPFPKNYDLILNLSITDDYIDSVSRVTYGAWLTSRQYDQTGGFVRRLITDLGNFLGNKKIALISDNKISQLCLDLYKEFKNIYPVTWRNSWDYYAEIAIDAVCDVTICRAANYQPFQFALSRGNNITTAVPTDGYMNEDEAAIQAAALRLTYNITYDDEQYIKKLFNFLRNKTLINEISEKQKNNFKDFGEKNNTIKSLFKVIKNNLSYD
jgi:hypothetical protein